MLESVARQSKVLKEMLDTCVTVQPENTNDSKMETELVKEMRREVEEEVPLPTIHSDHLKIVVRSENSFHKTLLRIFGNGLGCMISTDRRRPKGSQLFKSSLLSFSLQLNYQVDGGSL